MPAWATRPNAAPALERAAKDFVAAEGFTLETVPALGLARQPAEAEADFAARVAAAVAAEADERLRKIRGPRERRVETLERQIAEEARELERDRAERRERATATASSTWARASSERCSAEASGPSAARGRAGGRAYGRIQRAAEGVKESEEKIADWTKEADALRAEIENETARRAGGARGRGDARKNETVPIEKNDVRVLGWIVLWRPKT